MLPRKPMVLIRRLLFATVAIGLAVIAFGYFTATSAPVVRRAQISVPGLAAGETVRLLLISDIHVGGPDMPPSRLARIVDQISALRPDLVLVAGDLISDKRVATRRYSMAEAVAPLAALRPRLGTFAVLGNHDHWHDPGAARTALRRAGVTVLDNRAVQAGPLALGGLDDAFTNRADVPATLAQLRRLTGPRILLSHSPDPFAGLPADVPLMLAGHTHCGQIRLPLIGAPVSVSAYGKRYECGLIQERGRSLIVTAGLGTSGLPLRIGTVPDMWLIELRPAGARSPRR